jgi:competence protein ComEC
MTTIVLLAVLVDRSAISMRLVAWAAMIVLVFTPESI